MQCAVHIQDPTSTNTVYMYEAIIQALEEATAWDGVYAFASRAGIDALLTDPAVEAFLQNAPLSLIIGIDAVTNRETLQRLKVLEQTHPRLDVRVFWNNSSGLFHPKISRFRHRNGGQSVIVGSGNLTPGGLRENYEAFSVIHAGPRERLDLSSWDSFVREKCPDLRRIDQEALERAARNLVRSPGRRARRFRPVRPEIVEAAVEELVESHGERPRRASQRILVTRVPAAGARWHQVHFNRDVIDQFFRVRPDSAQRVYLTERRGDGTLAEQEVRRCVYSHTNKNFKIELGSRHDEPYPTIGRPIAAFREDQLRTFEYMLLLPGEPGHREMMRLTDELPSAGRGLPRAMTDIETMRRYWPECPLL